MNPPFSVKTLSVIVLSIFATRTGFAQANLIVDGAKVNLGTNIFLSTNDIKVINTNLLVSDCTLKIARDITSSGLIDVSNGTVEMNGPANQQIPADVFTGNIIKNLTINSSASVGVAGPLTLTHVLALSGGSFAPAGYLTLRSDSNNTARVAPVTTSALVPVSGEVIAERFITSRRAFRLLTAPVNTSGDVRANWMENTNNPNTSVNNNPVPHYGTHITGVGGAANGFDATGTNNPSLYTFNNQTQTYLAAANTSGLLHAGEAYRILVRGDRTTNLNLNAPPSSITTLRAKGTLVTGTKVMAKPGSSTSGMPELSTATGGYSFIANPYASPIDWLLLDRTDVAGTVYLFDPTISGTNGRGAYVTYNGSTGVSNIASSVDNVLQSGQAFFIQSTGANPSITFKENYKTNGNRNAFRDNSLLAHLSVQLLLPAQVTAGGAADGFAAYFSDNFDSSLQDEDSYKFINQDENIAILRDGKLLSIEGRKPVTSNDTLPLKSWQLSQKNYFFKVAMQHFDSKVEGYMEDSYTNTYTKFQNDDTIVFPITITSDSGSFASNRFKVVFKTAATLPVTLSAIKAYIVSNGVQVDWTATSEKDMEHYEIERSVNGHDFAIAGTVPARQNAGLIGYYNWLDKDPLSGDNYYRIRSVSKSGEIRYSQVVKVHITGGDKGGSIIAIAESAGSISIKLTNVEKGKYAVALINNAGQKLYSGTFSHPGGSGAQSIKINNLLPGGIYQVHLSSGDNTFNAPVIVP